MDRAPGDGPARVCVLAPAPLLTVAMEATDGPGDAEVHLHAGGQGYWIARLVAKLGLDVALCATVGGETGRVVVADLSGEPLSAAAEGGATVIKASHEELCRDGLATDDTIPGLLAGMAALGAGETTAVVCTRAERPALAAFGGRAVEVKGPVVEAAEPRGAGDSFTAGLAAALAQGAPFEDALRLGAAAGGLNVTRRGLGTGERDEIERLARHVEIREV